MIRQHGTQRVTSCPTPERFSQSSEERQEAVCLSDAGVWAGTFQRTCSGLDVLGQLQGCGVAEGRGALCPRTRVSARRLAV